MIPAARTAHTVRPGRPTSTARRLALCLAGLGVALSVSACGVALPAVVADPATDADAAAEQPSSSDTTDTTPDTTATTPDTTPDTTVEDGRINPSSPPVILPDYQTTVPTAATELPASGDDASSTSEPHGEPVVVPAGALDLGDGVVVEPAGSWVGAMDDDVALLTDGELSAQLQVLIRTPGEHPGVALREYVGSFEDDVEALSVSPARLTWSTTDPRVVEMYSVTYSTFDATAEYGRGLDGGITLLVRDDGLTLITDVWGPADVPGSLPDQTWNGLIDSFLAAPAVADSVVLSPIDDFRIQTAVAPVVLDGLAGFTAAPGFEVVQQHDDITILSNGVTEFLVAAPSAADGIEAFMERTVEFAVRTGAATFDEVVDHGVDTFGVEHRELVWSGTCDGQSCGGAIDVFVDAASGRAYLLSSTWRWNPADGSRPDAAAHRFMYRSMVDSFVTIPA